MYQKDYILRLIEQAAKVLAAILGQIKGGDLQKASENLDNFYYDILKEDAAFFRKIPVDELTKKLLQDHNYNNGHLEILAELFYTEAELCLAKNNKREANEFYEKSLRLFEYIDSVYKTYSQERINRMDVIRNRIKG